ncbi:MAG: PIG-L deacetylase family protein [Bdellovibrionota bacterium]
MKTLVVAAHPDDEVLGCGGVIAALRSSGQEVRVVIMGEGITSRPSASASDLAILQSAARKANAVLGVTDLHLENLPDNKFDTVAMLDIVQRVEKHVTQFRPERIFTHSSADLNVDHRLLHEAVITACRPIPGQTVKELYFFEVRSSTEWIFSDRGQIFQPKMYWSIGAFLEKKKLALQEYFTEMRSWPHSRSLEGVEHLARHRGAECGVDAAEAFAVGRVLR